MPIFAAQQLPDVQRSLSILPLIDFTGGLNLNDAGTLRDNESPNLCNVDLLPTGGFCSRRVVEAFHTDELSAKVCQLLFCEDANGNSRLFVSLDDGNVRVIDDCDTASKATPIPTATQPDDCCWQMEKINDRVYFYNGVDLSWCWENGETAPTELPNVQSATYTPADLDEGILGSVPMNGFPVAKCMEVHQGFAWAADLTEPDGTRHCNRIRRSYPLEDLEGEQSWGDLDWIDIDIGSSGECITAVEACGERLVVFKEHSTYVVAGFNEDNLQVFPISQDVGAVSCDAVCCFNGTLFFFDSNQGLNAFSGDRVTWQFSNLWPLMRDMEICAEQMCDVTVGCCNRKIMVSVPQKDDAGNCPPCNNTTYVLDTTIGQNGAWTKYDYGLGPHTQWRPRKAKEYCLAAAQDCNRVVKLDQMGDVDDWGCKRETVETYYCSRWLDLGNPYSEKRWCQPRLQAVVQEGGATITMEAQADFCESPVAVAAVSLDVPENPEPFTLGSSKLTKAPLERVSAGADPSPIPCATDDCDVGLKGQDGKKVKECGPDLGEFTACAMRFCIRGPIPSKEWCVCSLLILAYEEPIYCKG